MNQRAVAATIIARVLGQGVSLTPALAEQLAQLADPGSQSLVQEMCFGVMRWLPRLQGWETRLLIKPLKKKDLDVHALLLVGLYQLAFMRVPDHAAISETVAATRALKKPWAKNLVNAVLRNFQRERETLTDVNGMDESARYAHPDWLVQLVKTAWPQQWQAVLDASNERPPMTLRVNKMQSDARHYLEQLQQEGMAAVIATHADSAIRLETPCGVTQLPGFDAGAVSVQDEAAQLAAQLLDVQAGERVLDVCAAPGGKTAHILERQPQLEELLAIDIDARRIGRIHENLQRLQLTATVICGDAGQPQDWWDQRQFDRILVDAPCSATGVIRRHPDIKALRKPEDIDALVALQQTILDAIWPLLKTGGRMLYATCSVLPQENSLQMQQFVARHPDARAITPQAGWGIADQVGRQILPGDDSMDGFYYALLQKL